MGIVQRMFGGSEIECYSPLQIMHRINPELAAVAYADKEGIMSPAGRRQIEVFRALQSKEYIAQIEGMVQKYGYDAQVQINKDSEDGATTRTGLREDGLTKRVEIYEGGETKRTQLREDGSTRRAEIGAIARKYEADARVAISRDREYEATKRTQVKEDGLTRRVEAEVGVRKYEADARVILNRDKENGLVRRAELHENGLMQREADERKSIIDLRKMECEYNRGVLKDNLEGEKYLSNNRLKALALEAQSHVEAIRVAESFKSDTAKQLSKDELEASIVKSGVLMRQAYEMRGMMEDSNRREVSIAYIKKQMKINMAMINYHIEEQRANAAVKIEEHRSNAVVERAYYRTMRKAISEGTGLLKGEGKNKCKIRGGKSGELNLDIEVE